jgi:hypothetical protein
MDHWKGIFKEGTPICSSFHDQIQHISQSRLSRDSKPKSSRQYVDTATPPVDFLLTLVFLKVFLECLG